MSWTLISLSLIILLRASSAVADDPQINYSTQIAPLLSKNCVACHNQKKPEGGLNLESYKALMQGGDSGESVNLSNPDESELLYRVIAIDDSIMPPENNAVGAKQLTSDQIDLLRKWIKQGAPDFQSSVMDLKWNSITSEFSPVYALQFTDDGRQLVYGKGTQVVIRLIGPEKQQLQTLVDPELGTPSRAHLDFVNSLAVSSDQQTIATGGYRTVKLWQKPSALSPVNHLENDEFSKPAFSPQGEHLALFNNEQSLQVYGITELDHPVFSLPHAWPASSTLWLNDMLITCDSKGMVQAGHLNSPQPLSLAYQPVSAINQWTVISSTQFVGLTPNGTLHKFECLPVFEAGEIAQIRLSETPVQEVEEIALLATASAGEQPVIVAVSKSGDVQRLTLHGERLGEPLKLGSLPEQIVLDSTGELLVTLQTGSPARLWSLKQLKQIAELNTNTDTIRQLAKAKANVDRQQKRIDLLTSSLPQLKQVADKEEASKQTVQQSRDKASQELVTLQMQFATQQQELESLQHKLAEIKQTQESEADKLMTLEKQIVEKQKQIDALMPKVAAATNELAVKEQALATATDSAQRAARALPAQQQKVDQETQRLNELKQRLQHAEAKPGVCTINHVLFLAQSGQIALFDDQRMVHRYNISDGRSAGHGQLETWVSAITHQSNGQWLTISSNGQLQHWNPDPAWTLMAQIGTAVDSPFSGRVTALCFSPDSKSLLVGSGDPSRFGEVLWYDVASRQLRHNFKDLHSDSVLALQFSPSGDYFASAGADKLCRVTDLRTMNTVFNLEGHTHYVQGIAWRDDELILATGSADETVRVWDLQTGQQQRSITGFGKEVNSLAFVGTTAEIVTASGSGQIRQLNTQNGSQIRVLNSSHGAAYAIDCSTAANLISVGNHDGTVSLWQLSDGKDLTVGGQTE